MRWVTVVSAWMMLLATAAMAAPGDTLLVTGDVVNVRSGPGSNYRIRVQTRRGAAAVELSREGEWVEVELRDQGETGWIHDSLLTAGSEPAAPTEARVEPTPREAAPPVAPTAAEAPPSVEPADVATEPPVSAEARDAETPAATMPEPTGVTAAPAVEAVEGTPAPAAETATALAVDPISEFGDSVSMLNSRAVEVAGIDLFVGVEPVDDATVRVMVTDAWATVPEAGQQSYMNTLLGRWLSANGGSGPVRVEVIAPDGSVARQAAGP